jgi:hypothetical protein
VPPATRAASIDLRRLGGADLLQLAATAAFGVTIFLSWYATDPNNAAAQINGRTGSVSAWQAHPVERWFLVAAVVGGLVSAWTTVRAHEVGWGRGEMAVVVAATLVGLLLFDAFIVRPGSPPSAISLRFGWFLALFAALVGLGAAVARLPRARRKPPGV